MKLRENLNDTKFDPTDYESLEIRRDLLQELLYQHESIIDDIRNKIRISYFQKKFPIVTEALKKMFANQKDSKVVGVIDGKEWIFGWINSCPISFDESCWSSIAKKKKVVLGSFYQDEETLATIGHLPPQITMKMGEFELHGQLIRCWSTCEFHVVLE